MGGVGFFLGPLYQEMLGQVEKDSTITEKI